MFCLALFARYDSTSLWIYFIILFIFLWIIILTLLYMQLPFMYNLFVVYSLILLQQKTYSGSNMRHDSELLISGA